MARIALDLNNPEFQRDWFALERDEALAVLATLRKILRLDWNELYADRGFRWEAILSRPGSRRTAAIQPARDQARTSPCLSPGRVAAFPLAPSGPRFRI